MTGLRTHNRKPRPGHVLLAVVAAIAPTSAGQAQQANEAAGTMAANGSVATAFVEIAPAAAPAAEASARLIGSGPASYYSNELAGARTASGEAFDPQELTAAHRTLPFGSLVRVTNQSNGRSVVVRINDRGPFSRGRLIDVSYAAADSIGMVRSGHANVTLELVEG